MNKKYKVLSACFVVGAAMALSSCSDYLDSDKYFADRTTLEQVFTDKERSQEWLAYAFSFLKDDNADVVSKNANTNSFSFADDMYYGDRDIDYDSKESWQLSYNKFHMGEYNENEFNDAWGRCYKGIYQASIFIHNIDRNTDMTEKERSDYKGMARFVRAYYYWLLLRRYGPIPLMPDEGVDYTQSYDDLATPRSSYEECATFIADEMAKAASELQEYKRDGEHITQPTIGAALAARAIVLTFAASPLANGNTDEYAKELVDDQGRQLLNSDYQEEKWAKAAAACRDVIELGVYDLYHASFNNSDLPGNPATIAPADTANAWAHADWPNGWRNIDPLQSYRALFDGDVSPEDNPEIIFTRGNQAASGDNQNIIAFALHEMPRSLNGWNTHGITQKMCDAYYMNDGTDCPGKDKEIGRGDGSERLTGFTTARDYRKGKYKPLGPNVSLQYANREPRFYASVGYNGCYWEGLGDATASNHNKQVFYYRGDAGGNGYNNSQFYLRTGIGCRKYYNPNDYTSDYGTFKSRCEPAIRYADILLLYAECLNELDGTYEEKSWDGSQTYSISRSESEIKRGIHPIRIRAGLPDYTEETYASKDLLRAKIKRERMIELMGEGKRYFDLRRWKDAPVEENLQNYGCNVMMDNKHKTEFQQIIPIYNLKSTFADKMYFWPIRHDELKHNKRLTQNPGWTYND